MAGQWHGDRRRKSSHGGARGIARVAADRRWGVFSWRAVRHTAGRGRRGLLFGRLRGVEVEDEPQALDFVSNGCKID